MGVMTRQDQAQRMLQADEITVAELDEQLEARRRATHDLLMATMQGASLEDFEKFAPCSHDEYRRCPLRCA